MGYTTGNRAHEQKLLSALTQLKEGDFVLTNSSTIVNATIRYGSASAYGHAILYMGLRKGSHMFFELPHNYTRPSGIFDADRVNSAAFIHCKLISKKTRKKIMEYADAYRTNNADSVKNSFDVGGALQGVGSVVIGNTIGGAVGLVSPHAERDVRAFAESPNAVLNEVALLFTDYPALTCAGLVSWCHFKGGHRIDHTAASGAHTASPRSLMDAVKAAPQRFDVKYYDFD